MMECHFTTLVGRRAAHVDDVTGSCLASVGFPVAECRWLDTHTHTRIAYENTDGFNRRPLSRSPPSTPRVPPFKSVSG